MGESPDDIVTRQELAPMLGAARQRKPVEMAQARAALESRLFGARAQPVTLGRYILLDRIGAGGAGAVYRAYDPELEREVAVKLVHPDEAVLDGSSTTDRILREAQALAQLSHPNVVAVHDVGTYDPVTLGEDAEGRGVYIVMELVRGPTLREWLEAERRPWREVARVFAEAGRGLQAAHARDLVHRDFKPGNVSLGEDGRVRVLDFGLARVVGSPEDPGEIRASVDVTAGATLSRVITERGTIMGTPGYMAPEQHRGEAADARTDQFSFCVALAEGLAGTRLYSGEDLDALRASKEAGPPALPPEVPVHLRAVLERGLAAAPSDRFDSLAPILRALEDDPLARRRRWIGIGLVALVGVGGMTAAGAWWSGRGDVCEGARDELVGVWDATQRASVERAFLATNKPYAADTWRSVGKALDAYAAQWEDAHRFACTQTLVDRTQPSDVMARRMLCLEGRRARLEELTGLLGTGETALIESAVSGVGSLPPVDDCRAVDASAGVDVPLEGPGRDEVIGVERRLAEAETLSVAGRGEEALATVDGALAVARELKAPSLEARALVLRGDVLRRAGKLEEASDVTYDGFVLAERVGRPEIAADALTNLVLIVGHGLNRHAEADRHARLAEALHERHELGPAKRVQLVRNVGVLRRMEGRYEEARDSLEEALALAEGTFGPQHPHLASILGALGSVYEVLGRLDDALAAQERALSITVAAVGERHPWTAASHLNLGVVASMSGDYEAGLRHQETALEILEGSVGREHPNVATALNNYAVTLSRMGRYEDAIAALERSLAIKKALFGEESAPAAVAISNIGSMLSELGRDEEALARNRQALAIREKTLGPDHPEVGASLTNIGASLQLLGRSEEALPHLERSLQILEAKLGPESPHLVESVRWLGEAQLGVGRDREGRALLERALGLAIAGATDPQQTADSRFALARALADGQPARALELALAARAAYADMPGRQARLPAVDALLERLENGSK